MKRIITAIILSGACVAATAPAHAAIIFGVGFNGGAVTQVATDSGSGSGNYVATAGSYFYNSGAVGFPILVQPGLLTQSINMQQAGATAGTLNLYITQTDLTAFNGLLTSSFTSNTLSNATAVISSYYSTANALFGGTQLRSSAFNAMGVSSGTNLIVTTGLFSTTVRYDITFGPGVGNFNGTANLTGATAGVPEPATWAMMLLGFGGFGYAMRRRPRLATRARIRFA